MNKQTPEREPSTRMQVDPASELRNLQANSSATLAELRDFLTKLKGRKPQEVIGIVSASLLIQSLAISTFATIAILAIFTVVPYMIYGPPKTKAAAKPPAAKVTDANSAENKAEVNPSSEALNIKPDAAKAAKALGLDETKPADPNKNPLDSPNFDKLLDGLDNK